MIANLPFFTLIILTAAVLIFALVTGMQQRHTLGGKIMAIVAGLLLLLLAPFVSLVAIIVISGLAGHPF